MSSGPRWRIILVAEGPSDFQRIRVLLDHFLQKHLGATASLEQLRQYEGLNGEPYIKIKDIPKLAKARSLDRRYSPDGPNKGDGGTLRKLYQVLQKEKLLTPGNVILWARDDDGDKARRANAGEAREVLPKSTPLLFAIASECGEAWVIAGWQSATRRDEGKRNEWRRELGFDPHGEPERLSHKENVPKSAKAIIEDLFEGDEEEEAKALIFAAESDTAASVACGLRAFCEEVETWLRSPG